MILERGQQRITQIIIKQIQDKREICSVNTIHMSTALPPILNGIQKRIKTTNAFIDDKNH